MSCTASTDCAEVTDGCCMGTRVESFAEDSTWGVFAFTYSEDGESGPTAGEMYTQCTSAAFQELFQADVDLMPVTNLFGLDKWLSVATPEEIESVGLFEGDDATFWVESWGSDVYSMENLMVNVRCVEDFEVAEEAASALIAASATLLAVALLN